MILLTTLLGCTAGYSDQETHPPLSDHVFAQARAAGEGSLILEDPMVSAAWWASTTSPGGWQGDYYATEAEPVSDPALFVFVSDTTRCLQVEAWWTEGANRSRAATFMGRTKEGVEFGRATVDQRTGGGAWQVLGQWTVPAGDNAIALSRWSSEGVVIADAVQVTPCGAPAVSAELRLLSPGQGETVENPVRFELDGHAVQRVVLDADGWTLADWTPQSEGWSVDYVFSGTGTPRVVTATGLDSDDQVIATDTVTITVLDPSEPGALEVPYYYQYDNSHEPSATCGVSSAAMLLGSLGSGRTPDGLYLSYGKGQAQSPEGLAQLYRWEGFQSTSGRTATRSDLKARLDDGQPVVVHGFWTGAGHITVLVGYDEQGWIVNDPAGDWYAGYGSGHGEGVHYPFGSAWDDKLSWDGDIWWSTAW